MDKTCPSTIIPKLHDCPWREEKILLNQAIPAFLAICELETKILGSETLNDVSFELYQQAYSSKEKQKTERICKTSDKSSGCQRWVYVDLLQA